MRTRLSIGARWALRYTVAMSVTLAAFSFFVYKQVESRINREAHLVTEIHARELVDSLRTQTQEHPRQEVLAWLKDRLERTVRESPRDLHLGIQVLDQKGRPLASAGSLVGQELPVPLDVMEGRAEERLRAVNLGGRYADLVSVVRAPGGFVQVAIDTRRYVENVDFLRDVLVVALPLMLAATGAIGWFLARRSLASISEITESARRISGANLRESIPTSGSGDELDQLADTLNAMMERIREGVARMHRFNANAAHELRSPLNRICGQIEATLQRPREEAEYRTALTQALAEAMRLGDAVNALLRLSQSESGLDPSHLKRVDVKSLLDTLIEFFSPLAEERSIELAPGEAPAGAVVEGDPAWLRQLFSNLLDNAVKYCSQGDLIRLDASIQGGELRVSVADDGPGIAPEELDQIFERFGRGERHQQRPGFGLGLPLAREIARAHGGRVEVESRIGRGTTFTVWLPLAPS